MSNEVLIEILSRIEGKIDSMELNQLNQKEVLTFNEAARYTGLSRSYLYKLTSSGKIPHFKPNGKMIYFNREQLENWLLRNQAEREELEVEASTYVTLNKGGGQS